MTEAKARDPPRHFCYTETGEVLLSHAIKDLKRERERERERKRERGEKQGDMAFAT